MYWLSRAGLLLFSLFCAAGAAAGGFLLLCAGGFLNPDALLPRREEASVAVSAPAVQEAPSGAFQGIFLPAEAAEQAAFLSAGCSGVLVPMKTEEGLLEYVSALEEAANWQASSGDPQRNQALRTLTAQPGLHTVAVVSCLRDGLAGREPAFALLRPSGSPWLDNTGTPWLDPAQPEVQAYLIGVCREIALLGFDEILLTHCAYPPTAELQREPHRDRAAELETFCRQLQGALADLPVSLSILGEADALQDQAPSGQSAGLLASFPGQVWAKREDSAALAAFAPVLLPET